MSAIDDIAAERQRQIQREGWTPAHDDEHGDGALAQAAACYALAAHYSAEHKKAVKRDLARPDPFRAPTLISQLWPDWDVKWFKPKDARRDLVRAAALIAAEIDRLDRFHALFPSESNHGSD